MAHAPEKSHIITLLDKLVDNPGKVTLIEFDSSNFDIATDPMIAHSVLEGVANLM